MGHARPSGGDPPDDVGVMEERLHNLGFLGSKHVGQVAEDAAELPATAGTEEVDLDVGRPEGIECGRLLAGRRWFQA